MAAVRGKMWGAYKDYTNPIGLPQGAAASKSRYIVDSYTATALAAGSTITFGPLPEKAVVVGATIYQSGLGAGVTLKLGTDQDDDLIQLQFDAAASSFNRGVTNPDGFLYQATKGRCLIITTGGAAATGEIRVAVEYLID